MITQSDQHSVETPALTVYYDGACPICSREIATYKNMQGAEQVHWQDVAAENSEHATEKVADDLTRADALARMHVRRADGTLASGAEAFALMWQAFPKTRLLGRIAATRPALWVLEPAYDLFLRLRPLWRRAPGA